MARRTSDAADADRYDASSKSDPGISVLIVELRSPLKSSELKVLRDQYEKEGDYVGVQTKFNYAWVGYGR